MQKGQKHDSQKWQKWELRFRPFCIQTGAASKLIKLESCGWSQMKAYSKSFNFFFLFFIFDHGKVVKVNKEPGSKKSRSKSKMVWWRWYQKKGSLNLLKPLDHGLLKNIFNIWGLLSILLKVHKKEEFFFTKKISFVYTLWKLGYTNI